MCQIKPYPWRRNYSLLARYSLKFTRHSLLIVKSLVARCKIPWLLIACCKVCSLLVAEVARCKKIVRYSLRYLLVTHCRSCSFQQITGFALQNSLDTPCKKSFFVKRITRWNYCLFKVKKVRGKF